MVKNINFMALVFGLAFISQVAAENYPLALGAAFVNYVKDQGGIEKAREIATRQTEKLRSRCADCHQTGKVNTKFPRPHLSAQQPLYFVQQLQNFVDARRSNLLMHGMTRSFSQTDIFNLALHFSGEPPYITVAAQVSSSLNIQKGKQIYLDRCQHCHGPEARGQGVYARLASQNRLYLIKNITSFRDKKKRRSHVGMSAITSGLSNQQVEQIAMFLSSLN